MHTNEILLPSCTTKSECVCVCVSPGICVWIFLSLPPFPPLSLSLFLDQIANAIWWYYFSKFIEFSDTVSHCQCQLLFFPSAKPSTLTTLTHTQCLTQKRETLSFVYSHYFQLRATSQVKPQKFNHGVHFFSVGYTIGIAVHACLYVEYYVHGHAVVLVLLFRAFLRAFYLHFNKI